MVAHVLPPFHNTPGVPVIEIGAREFQCVGATPPFDHPHVFLDMGDAKEIICPYCSTLYRHDASLNSHSARPPECALESAPCLGAAARTVIIAGAGIGGLTAALALAQRGFEITVLEAADRLEEIGA